VLGIVAVAAPLAGGAGAAEEEAAAGAGARTASSEALVEVGPGSAVRTFASSGSGTELVRSTVVGGQKYQLKSGHAFMRPHASGHISETGLSMSAVENAILDDLEKFQRSGGVVPTPGAGFTGPMQRTIVVGGIRITYRSVDTGRQISVGTYFVP